MGPNARSCRVGWCCSARRGLYSLLSARFPVGAGLLAKASAQQTLMLTDPPLSRASPLPQVSNRAQGEIAAIQSNGPSTCR
ncbi:hypothetical protein FJD34_10280 [Pseudomonas brenneri]|uniref:Uncharacterized protein n=1 Tax=Pseudomonas brenneri TaxID=129817 RepID=A0A5B2V0F7_9PSED|nr:hypothetical protein [Pseudomonas brenneri]KAA2231719.1 hypothetical protein F1720_06525 [Pseudomonas brenneri]TWR79345.1 hypothetical protein FJD34_10280 [Pseudomonas brenneri]